MAIQQINTTPGEGDTPKVGGDKINYNFSELDLGKANLAGGNSFQGNQSITGNMVVEGDLIVQGSEYEADLERLMVKDNSIVMNDGEAGTGVTAGYTFIESYRGPTTNPYVIEFRESDDSYRIGELQRDNGFVVSSLTNTVTLDSNASIVDDFYNTKEIIIRKTGLASQRRTITDYNGTTKVATLNSAFSPLPDNTWEYKVIVNDETQALATREDSPVNNTLQKWDDINKRFVSTSVYTSLDGSNVKFGTGISSPSTALDIYNVPEFSDILNLSYGSAVIRGYDISFSPTQKGILDIEMSGTNGGIDRGATLTFSVNRWKFGMGYNSVMGAFKIAKEDDNNQIQKSYMAFYTNNNASLEEAGRFRSNGIFNLSNTPEYADNTAAKTAGLLDGDVYRTGDLLKIVHS